MYHYLVFGLNVVSEIEIDGQYEASFSTQPDVTIRIVDKLPEINKCLVKGFNFEATKNQFVLQIEDVAHFLVQNGNDISIVLLNTPNLPSIRAFLLGSVFSALLQQQQKLTLHGSAVNVDGEAVLFLGESGMGKSTMAAMLSRKGYATISDDVSALDFSEPGAPASRSNRAKVIPAYPYLKLWPASLEHMDMAYDGLPLIRDNIEKRLLPVSDFCSDKLPVKAIYLLTFNDSTAPKIEDVCGVDKPIRLLENVFRSKYVEGLPTEKLFFQLAVQLSQSVPIKTMSRNKSVFQEAAVLDCLLSDLAE